jgi:hypothetical protein
MSGTAQGSRRRYYKGHYLTELSDDAIEAFLSQGEPALKLTGRYPQRFFPGLRRRNCCNIERRQRLQLIATLVRVCRCYRLEPTGRGHPAY